ncbi:MAG: 4Fe-4S dicluster domain-containing protein [Clostridiales bacterium]|jgi:iron only hydrogenase large subunit-like protein|nr:4Fe-4S dicluster domain-containing protein [Clostridiales bacterium]
MTSRFHSVRLIEDKCRGCTNCLKHCPTEAIRVYDKRAHIIDERCIDCGECIRICDYHAKVAQTDTLEDIKRFPHPVALPAPTLYGQFRHLTDISVIYEALLSLGFKEVADVARGADVVTLAIRRALRDPQRPRPLISSACPTITRIIQVRYPALIPNIINLRQPMEVAAQIARRDYASKHGVAPEDIGIFFITPCAAKMTSIRSPIGHAKSAVDGAISILEIYGHIAPLVGKIKPAGKVPEFSPFGMGWAGSGGELDAAAPRNSIAVDGIDNVIRVLEEMDNNTITGFDYFEGSACLGGCVGGPLNFENNYLARNTIQTIQDAMPKTQPEQLVRSAELARDSLYFDQEIPPNDSMKLHESIAGAIERMEEMNRIIEELPGYDCGSCGSPTCRSFAEDIVRGNSSEHDCIYILKDTLKVMAQKMVDISKTKRE